MKRSIVLISLLAIAGATTPAPATPPVSPSDVVSVMQRAADWQQAHMEASRPATEWTNGVYDAGLLALAGVSGDQRYEQIVVDTATRIDWRLGPRLYFADDQTIAQSYLELYFRYHEPEAIGRVRGAFDAILADPPPNPNVLRIDTPRARDKWSWCDALFMAPAAWANMTAQTGDRRYLEFMNAQFWRTVAYLYDPRRHLFFRDSTYFNRRSPSGAPIFWARGNGWVIAGIARTLSVMPQNDALRPRFVALFRELASRLYALQGSDGAWRPNLLDANEYPAPETSSTGLITYAFAWGVNEGILGARYRDAALRGWDALSSHVGADGRLGFVQPTGKDPQHAGASDSGNFGTGTLLLAGSEVYKLQLLAAQPHKRISVDNPRTSYRYAQTIELSLDDLARAFPNTPVSRLTIVDGTRSRLLDSQILRISEGAERSVLIFQTDIAPRERRSFFIIARPAGLATPAPADKTYARFVPERMDDFAWENDRIAHRVYGQALITGEGTNNSGVDVWVKSKRGSIIDEWYKRGDYHVDHGDGLDCYDNGSSRGDGGSGVWSGDTLYIPSNFTHWKVVANGPIRSEFVLTYGTFSAGTRQLTESRRFTLDAGSNMTRIRDTWFANDGAPLDVGVAVVTARWPERRVHSRTPRNLQRIPTAPSDAMGNFQTDASAGWIEDWQQNGVPPRNTMSAGATGVAALVPPPERPHVGYAEGHYLLNATVLPAQPLTYYVGAGWSKLDFPDQRAWRTYVANYASDIATPLTVTIARLSR